MYLIFFPPLPLPPLSLSLGFFFSSFFPPPFFFSVVQISCLCLGVAETSCYLPSLKMLIKGTTFPKNLGSSLPKEGKGARLGQKPPGLCRALASCRPPAPFPSHHQNKGRHLYLYNFFKYIFMFLYLYTYISSSPMLPTKFLHIQDSLNKLMHLKKRRSPIYLTWGRRREREETRTFLKET